MKGNLQSGLITNQAEQLVLDKEGLSEWVVVDAVDGYCWGDQKKIQRIPGDFALFLHEVAHALCYPLRNDPLWNQDTTGHHAMWGDTYTRLVRTYMVASDALTSLLASLQELEEEHQALLGATVDTATLRTHDASPSVHPDSVSTDMRLDKFVKILSLFDSIGIRHCITELEKANQAANLLIGEGVDEAQQMKQDLEARCRALEEVVRQIQNLMPLDPETLRHWLTPDLVNQEIGHKLLVEIPALIEALLTPPRTG